MIFTLWDVEHGVSIWVVTPNGHHHCFDLGKTGEFSPSQHMAQRYGVKNIDFLTISHPDKDHIEDLPNFIRYFGQPTALTRNPSLPDKEFLGSGEASYQKYMYALHRNFTAPVHPNTSPLNPQINGGIEYRLAYLSYGKFTDGCELTGNNTSIVTFMLYQDVLFVYPGDIEPKGWNEFWKQYGCFFQPFIDKARIKCLVAPHHGRESGYSQEMMDSIKPNLVFISDKWGASTTHPSYYTEPKGITINNTEVKCLSTKTFGRIACEVTINGGLKIHQFENQKTYNNANISPSPSI